MTGAPAATGGAGATADPDCFAPFDVDGSLPLADLDGPQRASICDSREQAFHCIYPDDALCTYLGAALSQGEPVQTCIDTETLCIEEGGPAFPGDFECSLEMGANCSGTVAEFQTCMRDTLQAFADLPPVEWTCENREAILERVMEVEDLLPDSCIQFDGCPL